ncbi:BREX system serine/threonine kinase PglW [Phytoactinopolyspora sp. XMNu-373]|uniref:non-specific serine/threonine protein kinase n=1 Tax=Phytoactinopolyspora mesophila TaxID=2650750 RepID=A0A7K3MDC5_9ACTN|nr:BREX system serine/threonine kinase PglW [Phytoactinopolyspora mesophila]NDL60408.1 BREX system serine/threonine kinase PglW [Phytoactinopolyspora mesophila]
MQSDRWVEVSPSQFPHEAEGLKLVRQLLPDAEPFRAWSNFEFRDTHGRWHEVDLLVLGRDTLFLVELKYYRGILSGNDHLWRRDGHRAEDSPLKLARRKAQYLASLLKDRLRDVMREKGDLHTDPRKIVPFVQEAVFLHHPHLVCELPTHARQGIFGLEDHERTSGLAPLSELLLAPAKRTAVTARNSELLAGLIRHIGLAPRRQREVGSWVIDDEPLAHGDGWQDWPAFHRVATTDRYRIRFYIPKPDATRAETLQLERQIAHEHQLLSRLRHDGLLVPRDLIKDELGIGLVFNNDERLARLDLWLADHGQKLALHQQLDIIRQLAEALSYAHRHRVVHRGMAPSAVFVRERSGGGLAVTMSNWDAVGSVAGTRVGDMTSTGISADLTPAQAGVELSDEDQLFEAPEGRWNPDADRIRLDVFALGAIAFYVLTNQTLPAQDRGALVDRLRRDSGLDLSAELPQISSALRELVLAATKPRPSERTANVAQFLAQLELATSSMMGTTATEEEDPLEAQPGAVMGTDGRFTYVRKLGSGSTAVGILVKDAKAGDALRVLKVAKDPEAKERLEAEAGVLGRLNHERIAMLIHQDKVGPRKALVLQHAGDATLADELASKRGRLSLDLLERWGGDLLDALVVLDHAGINHRDIKPSNLGVHQAGRSKTETHLMLFDFSMAGTAVRAISAGTPPYLDPFLGQDGRTTYDSAAERYGAAVVLYEMATGRLPQYGDDPGANPASVSDDVTIPPEAFDPAVAEDLATFFGMALSRNPKRRHDTAEDMRHAWRAIFKSLGRYGDETEQKVASATLETVLADAGLSARAISALEPAGVATVADLLALDPAQLNRLLSREIKSTREEIKKRVNAWRRAFKDQLKGISIPARRSEPATLAHPVAAAELLAAIAGTRRTPARQSAARLILGLEPGLDAFANQQELASAVGRSAQRGHQLIKELQDAWSKNEQTQVLLDQLVRIVIGSLDTLGGVASVPTLTTEVLAALPDLPDGSSADAERLGAGLLRLTLDRYHEHVLAETEMPLAKRRRGGRLALLARSTVLLDAAEAAGACADELVAAAQRAGEPVVPQQRAARQLRLRFTEAFRAGADAGDEPPAMTDLRLARLAARSSREAALSARGELHRRNLPGSDAIRMALAGLAQNTELTPSELAGRVRARFPELDPLPERPDLDAVVDASGVGLQYLPDRDVYGVPSDDRPDTTGFPTRTPTVQPAPTEASLGRGDHLTRVLAGSMSSRSFLAIGISAQHADQPVRATRLLAERYGGTLLDVTGLLIDEMRTSAQASKLPWDVVSAADAAQPGSRDARGLHTLVERVMPRVTKHIDALVFSSAADDAPVILTELSPLARYGHLNVVARWSDLAARRQRPVWVILPQLAWMRGAVVDGKPLQLGSDGQFVALDLEWVAMQEQTEPGGDRVQEGSR